ncbi:E3 ubiquitin-protein ligase TRIM9-like protein [Leptotrombidium deliense]|uniref:E3 ubiquitin-protein ligase TRIM9-like protein n=1 Tax=Leptotrombidium deliense TaxID=299467 RepID=A0A443SUY5_9ACAR|nr:E3 ubiquitin-protein ligase TRIM9-like protein [Leptotrombidium deliense]
MEEELKCPLCKNFFNNAVLLPCFHSLCFSCVIAALNSNGVSHTANLSGEETAVCEVSSCCNVSSSSASSETSDVDKLSLLSETDSGVICTSRPNSYVGTPNIQTILFPPLHNVHTKSEIQCPMCNKVLFLDESSAPSLPKNKVLQSIVDKYEESKSCATLCQLCERNPKEAVFMCEQCEVFYCELCRESCHPFRGPLAKHTLINPQQGKTLLRCKSKSKDWSLNSFCLSCKVALCSRCLQEDKHATHDMQSLALMCKSQKVSVRFNVCIFLCVVISAVFRDFCVQLTFHSHCTHLFSACAAIS